jgi:Holliday junction DNA helicase RuvA
VREDALQLFGFATPLEHDLFQRLIAVSGIGPKVALAVLSGIEPADLIRAIRSADVARLTRIPGVGRKTAERIVLELKDRLPDVALPDASTAPGGEDVRADLLSALANLGYPRAAAEQAGDRVLQEAADRTFEPLLRATLKRLMGGAGR